MFASRQKSSLLIFCSQESQLCHRNLNEFDESIAPAVGLSVGLAIGQTLVSDEISQFIKRSDQACSLQVAHEVDKLPIRIGFMACFNSLTQANECLFSHTVDLCLVPREGSLPEHWKGTRIWRSARKMNRIWRSARKMNRQTIHGFYSVSLALCSAAGKNVKDIRQSHIGERMIGHRVQVKLQGVNQFFLIQRV
ncbi:hypothetical protein C5167_019737 [Papaver somniferum]|uniref:Uncharacterized protein n=1 Tax=Papaver somniferum TaxID=3469 RepID=A0A4Y7IUY5_PAPSO|nr:uncharacterized protein LOC113351976 [Papaver somniferum]RZC51308.1 hypothetical protein C5167_019737 [Papaver somniferum]